MVNIMQLAIPVYYYIYIKYKLNFMLNCTPRTATTKIFTTYTRVYTKHQIFSALKIRGELIYFQVVNCWCDSMRSITSMFTYETSFYFSENIKYLRTENLKNRNERKKIVPKLNANFANASKKHTLSSIQVGV